MMIQNPVTLKLVQSLESLINMKMLIRKTSSMRVVYFADYMCLGVRKSGEIDYKKPKNHVFTFRGNEFVNIMISVCIH